MENNKKYIFIDIGASNGCMCIPWIDKYPNSILYAFEPEKNNYLELKDNLKNYSNANILNMAVSDTNGTKKFYVAGYTNSSSLLEFNDEEVDKFIIPDSVTEQSVGGKALHTVETYDVETIRLDTFLNNNNIDVVDFMKIDVQGHDFDVFKSLGNRIKDIKEVVLEVPTTSFDVYKNSYKKKDVMKFMEDNGFKPYKIQSWTLGQEENIEFINTRFPDEDFLHLDDNF